MAQPFKFSATAGSIPSVVHGSDCSSMDCVYMLQSPTGMKDLQLNFSLHAPMPFGHLALYKGRISSNREEATWEGIANNETRTFSLIGDYSSFLLHYHSEATNGTIYNYSGFNVSFQWLPTCECKHRFPKAQKLPKTITSPNYPSNYCGGLRCEHEMLAYRENWNVVLSINSFRTENENDYLKVFDGDGTYHGRLMEKFSGTLPLPTIVRSTGQFLTLYFHTDGSVTDQGFSIEYHAAPPLTTTTTLSTTTSTTTSPTPSPSPSPTTGELDESSDNVSNSPSGWLIVTVVLVVLGAVAVCVIGYLFYTGRLTFKKNGVTHAYYNHRDSNLTLDDAENGENVTTMI